MPRLIQRGFEVPVSAAGAAAPWRRAGPAGLRTALQEMRSRTLSLFGRLADALGDRGLHIPFDPVLNLPLWELGHLGWFEEYWIDRLAGRERERGTACDPAAPRAASCLPQADALYDSARIEHTHRWQLELPGVSATVEYLGKVRERTLKLLADSAPDDQALYFFRLALLHEAMHHEAWHFMAQRLGIDAIVGDVAAGPVPPHADGPWTASAGEWTVPEGEHRLGHDEPGFAFDNELGAHGVPVAAFRIDRAPVSWQRYLPFIEDRARATPPHLRRAEGVWQQQRFGVWTPLDLAAPAMHLSAHDAEAWCDWAGRRLPSEAEWERAATLAETQGEAFDWGQVWEWTASPFAPYPGFVAHPYREYSQPWFDGRPVLRGASFATDVRLRHARYRNFFAADRCDVFSGFRSCALG